jgi:hypothetical protein
MARPRTKPEGPKRRRGGQPGNTNRLVHGRYTHESLARRALVHQVISKAWKTLGHWKARDRSAADPGPTLPPPPNGTRFE